MEFSTLGKEFSLIRNFHNLIRIFPYLVRNFLYWLGIFLNNVERMSNNNNSKNTNPSHLPRSWWYNSFWTCVCCHIVMNHCCGRGISIRKFLVMPSFAIGFKGESHNVPLGWGIFKAREISKRKNSRKIWKLNFSSFVLAFLEWKDIK